MDVSTSKDLLFRPATFSTLVEALDYAALGTNGLNFYSGRGTLAARLSYRDLKDQAVDLAKKLLKLGMSSGQRVALVAETGPDFVRYFFACQYAGLIPVPLPAVVKLGAHATFVTQLRNLLEACDATIAVSSEGYVPFLEEAAAGLGIDKIGSYDEFVALPSADDQPLPTANTSDIAYIQYTSGSTRFPKGVVITHQGAISNLQGIAIQGVKIQPSDRLMSWLPFYHDMGLVGFLLVPVATQINVDYLATHEFAMRPRLWLSLMTQTKATISFSPCFGYDLCARRLRDGEASKFDLSNWRVAGIGAEMIRPKSLDLFAEALAPAGFKPSAFMACYGMAECTLGVSFSPLNVGYTTDYVDMDALSDDHRVVLLNDQDGTGFGRHFVNCGQPLPSYQVEVRDDNGDPVGEYQAGVIHLRGPSVMVGYFGMPEETRQTLSADGWLNTGDIGYMANGTLTITGRQKDLIIIHGRNIWPQDLEHLCETQPEVRVGDALAFSVACNDGDEACIVLVECRETDDGKRRALIQRLRKLLREDLSLDCIVELVPPRSLPVTSSGKLSRSKARLEYMAGRLGNFKLSYQPELSGRIQAAPIPATGG